MMYFLQHSTRTRSFLSTVFWCVSRWAVLQFFNHASCDFSASDRQFRQSDAQSATRRPVFSKTSTAMTLRDELLKSIWHAFTALDVDKSGKVSKSQLKVNIVFYSGGLSCCVVRGSRNYSRGYCLIFWRLLAKSLWRSTRSFLVENHGSAVDAPVRDL